VPPLADTEADPLVPPLQETLLPLQVPVNKAVEFTVAEAIAVQRPHQ